MQKWADIQEAEEAEAKRARMEAKSVTPNFPAPVATGWEIGHVVVAVPRTGKVGVPTPVADAFLLSRDNKHFVIFTHHTWDKNPSCTELMVGPRGSADEKRWLSVTRANNIVKRSKDLCAYQVETKEWNALCAVSLIPANANVGDYVSVFGGATQTVCPNAKITAPNVYNASTQEGDSGTPVFLVHHGASPYRKCVGMHLGTDGTGQNRYMDIATIIDALDHPNSL
jgi:hypothetical protein